MEALSGTLVILIAVVFVMSASARFAELKWEQAKLNNKLDLLLKHHGIDMPMPPETGYVPPDLIPQLRGLIEERQKVKAIKLLRDRTGASLVDAKNAVEALALKL